MKSFDVRLREFLFEISTSIYDIVMCLDEPKCLQYNEIDVKRKLRIDVYITEMNDMEIEEYKKKIGKEIKLEIRESKKKI